MPAELRSYHRLLLDHGFRFVNRQGDPLKPLWAVKWAGEKVVYVYLVSRHFAVVQGRSASVFVSYVSYQALADLLTLHDR